jgi:hydrogenase maturation protease
MPSYHHSVRIIVAGLGNELLRDDGVGVHLTRKLAENPPSGVTIIEAGTAVWHLVDVIKDGEYLLTIDAMLTGRPPGTVVTLCGKDMQTIQRHNGAHGLGLTEALALNNIHPAEIAVVGIEPAEITYGTTLTEVVTQALPYAEEAVRQIVSFWQSACSSSNRITCGSMRTAETDSMEKKWVLY